MYALFGKTRSTADAWAVLGKFHSYNGAANGFSDADGSLNEAVALVMAHNEGSGADAFYQSVTSGGSAVVPWIGDLAAAAGRTSNAYVTASLMIVSARLAMDAIVANYGAKIIVAQLLDRASVAAIQTEGTNQLTTLETRAVTQVDNAFSALDLPQPLDDAWGPQDQGDAWGNLDDGIAEYWANMTDKERLATLQAIADEYADANGIPRQTLQLAALGGPHGEYRNGQVYINISKLNDPRMIGIAIHEMEHSAQYYGMDPSNGTTSPEEAQRWRELNEPHVRDKGGQNSYTPRPVEVGARAAGRDFVDNLSYEEFLEYV